MPRTPPFKEIIARSPLVFVIGVAGDSGSGKTTFTNAIREIFGPDLVATITLDDYHTYDREERHHLDITPLHPDANNLSGLEADVAHLKQGYAIEKPVYNHATGTFDPPIPFPSKKILILEGLHTLFTPALRDLVDFSVFVDPDREVKYAWKRQRDTGQRGYSPDEVNGEIARREADYATYIEPQRCNADAIIRIGYSKYGKDLGPAKNVYSISLLQNPMDQAVRNTSLSIDLTSLLAFHESEFSIEFSTQRIECSFLRSLTFDGEMNYDTVRNLELSIEHQTGIHPIEMFAGRKVVTPTNIVQLLLSWRIINRRIFLQDHR
ncbi:phosphoribulokinase/uridine kinase [Methanoregula boonei 6A8]|uniref:phosphoribulokinase n=1 Tax=Methanoregula boonei (strain DSM 21154 / JCM 14090 / 6A8) TaxID=456442 RepID=A7I4Y6_METB6|nr:phosphoribulokinase [Methanoregula boonei]ABS54797.1 phosphoribulokinase/uridine kinase [Methanoregula boonei 6A8]